MKLEQGDVEVNGLSEEDNRFAQRGWLSHFVACVLTLRSLSD